MQRGFARHGLAAGLSTVLAVGAGILINLATSGSTWSVGAGLVVLAIGWVGVEMWRAGHGPNGGGHGASTSQDHRGIRRRSLAPPTGLLPNPVRGRTDLLTSLNALVDAPDGRPHVLCGLGGSGKTTVALAVATTAAGGARVWWISAQDETSLTADLVDLMVELGATPEELRYTGVGVRSLIDLVWQRLDAVPTPWLLVVDDVDQPDLLAADGARVGDGNGVVRGSDRGLVLLTSRVGGREVWGGRAVLHPVAPLGSSDGGRVLSDLAPQAGKAEDAASLAARLGGLPLALRVAGRYLGSTSAQLDHVTTFAAYRSAVDAKFAALMGPATGAAGPRDAVTSTWEVSLDLLARQGLPQARALMRLVGGFAPAPIPVALLDGRALYASRLFVVATAYRSTSNRAAAGWTRIRERLKRVAGYEPQVHRRTIGALCDLGLLDLTTRGSGLHAAVCLTAHPLVIEANAASLAGHDAAAHAVGITVVRLLCQAVGGRDPYDPAEHGWWPLLAPHMADALVRTAPGLPQSTVAALVDAACTTVQGIGRAGDYLTGYTLAATTLASAARHLPARHPSRLNASHRFGHSLDERGRYEQAQTEYEKVLPARVQVLGAHHPDTLNTRHNLALALSAQGAYDQAATELRTVLVARQRVLGVDHRHTLRARQALAEVLVRQGLYSRAEEEYHALLSAQQRTLGAEHPDTLRTWHGLADVLARRGLYDHAETEFTAVLSARQRVLGPEHPFSLLTRCSLAAILVRRGLYDQAETEYRALVGIQGRVFGEHHPDTLRTRHGLANLLTDRGQHSQAEAGLTSVLHALRSVLGSDHPDTLLTQCSIARVLARRDRHDHAKAAYQTVLDAQRRVLGDEHPDVRETRAALERLDCSAGQRRDETPR